MSRTKKGNAVLLHVITDFSASAGAETMLARLLRVSKEPRLMVAPLIGVSDRNRSLSDNANVDFRPLGMRSVVSLPRAVGRLSRLIRQEKPSALLCWMYHGMCVGTIAARVAGARIPVYWTVRQALDDPAALTRNTRLALATARRLSPRAAGIIYNSSRALEQHAAYGYADGNAAVIPNGFEMPELGAPAPRSPRVFGIAGRFHPQKDHETFFRAAGALAAKTPDARFVAAGDGMTSDNPKVAAMIKAAQLAPERVELLGQLRDMAPFYRRIDALVLSSRTEGFPNVVAEAMSYAKPVVTTDVGDAATIVGQTGKVTPARDDEALAAAMTAIAQLSPDAYGALAAQARARVSEYYSLEAVAAAYRRFLGGLG